ncbi:G-type lectin S-receptor-like serine/threonine-protein kinase B120 [Asparagus officinalis]|uniref:G-type lectin S-receptor-like serine/threonine-protein kinase B120 n=1 Tax=Asparagus officinalis TaxID=4686 RepID=UPI00098DFD04|nr:G-type lectin S-receptor-like serine/threonine-protein kinase B120 [Asparagus officinalis]
MNSLLLFLSFTSLFLRTLSTDSLTPTQPLTDGSTLISSGQIFELGFFSPQGSAKRYVGIWYHNFSTDTVLWVANRQSPVLDRSGSLRISASGNLILVNGENITLWSSNVTISINSKEMTVQLLDNGNLQLNDSWNVVWQSFDYPTDTYLTGMKDGLDMVTNVNQLFTSWKSPNDPEKGNYSMGIDPDRSTQIFIWEGTKPRWRSGQWNGQVFIGVRGMLPMYIYGFKLSNFEQEGKMYFYYSAFNASHRYVLSWDGSLKHLIWQSDTQGFVPKSIDEWENGNWTNGCTRRTTLSCERNTSNGDQGEQDGFLMLQGVKLPDLSDWDQNSGSISRCEQTCLANCSCKAYSFVTGIGCLKWGGDLVDIYMFSSGGENLYVKLAGSELGIKIEAYYFYILR